MSCPSSVIVVGSINTDLVIRGSRLPGPGETVLGGEFYHAAGGKGANQAVAAARAGLAPVTLIGAVGDDALGREAFARFRCENMVCDYLKSVTGQPSGVALILVDHQGQNLISVASGANSQLTPADLEVVPKAVFSSAKVFLTCLEIPLETVSHGLRLARQAGLMTILNPAPATLLPNELLELVDVLTPNESEAAMLARSLGTAYRIPETMSEPSAIGAAQDRHSLVGLGTPVARLESALGAARQLQSRGCRSVIVTLGEQGCLVVDREITSIAGESVAAIDATAAGDAFNGALAVALAEGHSLVRAARWAGIAAAISVTRLGAQQSLAMRDEIERRLRQHS